MGQRPIPLNEIGRRQANGVAEFLKDSNLRAVYSSPVLRAMETANAIAKPHMLTVQPHDGLAEIDYGDWIGKTYEELERDSARLWREYHTCPHSVELPNGEDMKTAARRITSAVSEISAKFDSGRVAIVSHADVLKIAVLNLIGIGIDSLKRFSIDNCATLIVRMHPIVGPRLILFNYKNGFGLDM